MKKPTVKHFRRKTGSSGPHGLEGPCDLASFTQVIQGLGGFELTGGQPDGRNHQAKLDPQPQFNWFNHV